MLPTAHGDGSVGSGLLITLRNIGVGPALDVQIVTMRTVFGFPQPAKRSGPYHLAVREEARVLVHEEGPISGVDLEVRLFYSDNAGLLHWSAFTYWRRGVTPARVGVGSLPRDLWLPERQVDWNGAPPEDDRGRLKKGVDVVRRRLRRRPNEQKR